MKIETMIEWLQELPKDYEICFSEYTSIITSKDSTSEEYFVVLDMPIVGMLKNDKAKVVRFFTKESEERVIKEIEDGRRWKKLK